MHWFSTLAAAALLAFAACANPVAAQDAPATAIAPAIKLSAALSGSAAPLTGGLHWRLFNARAEADGSHALVSESTDAQPLLPAPPGEYVVHVAFGLASSAKRVSVTDEVHSEKLTLSAGALKIGGTLGDSPIDPNRLSIAIYVPEHNNPEAKLVYARSSAGELIGLPEGSYHIVSTYLDATGVGSVGIGKEGGGPPSAAIPSNSIVNADIRVPTGKIIDVTLRHRYAKLTLKLVNTPGAEALANTNFTVLTPGGDPIRELIGAFPSLVLAEGEYDVIARHDSKTFQSSFKVESGQDRDVEVIATDGVKQDQ